MHSLSALLKRSKKKPHAENASPGPEVQDSGIEIDNDREEKLNRRQSRRGDFFRSFLNKIRPGDLRPEAQSTDKAEVCGTALFGVRLALWKFQLLTFAASQTRQSSESYTRSEQTFTSAASTRRPRTRKVKRRRSA
jgi:hypothetical protein